MAAPPGMAVSNFALGVRELFWVLGKISMRRSADFERRRIK